MMKLLSGLSELLEEEKTVFEALQQILSRESDAVITHDLELLNEAVKEKEYEALNLRFLEKKREKIIADIAYQIGRPKDDVSMALLIALADEARAMKLENIWQELTPVVEKVRHLARKNKALMESSLHFIKDAAFLIERISARNPIYLRTGSINQKYSGGRILCGSI